MALRDAGELLLPAVEESLNALNLGDADTAAARLACSYAAQIDGAYGNDKLYAWSLRWLGPLLNAVLNDLGATPLARSRVKDERPPGGEVNRLAQLRSARRA